MVVYVGAAVKWIEVEFLGAKYRIPALKHQGRLWFHWQGESYAVDAASGTRRQAAEKTSVRPGVIAAPMPGKITRVGVAKGESVKKGQPLIVMEAMKMEYTLEADRDGKIQEVSTELGAQVGLGEVLVRLEDL